MAVMTSLGLAANPEADLRRGNPFCGLNYVVQQLLLAAALILAGCAASGSVDSEQACLYRTKDKQHHTQWASCRVPPPEANTVLMGR